MSKKPIIIRIPEDTKKELERRLKPYNLSIQKTLSSAIDLILNETLPLSTEGICFNDNKVIANDNNNEVALIKRELEAVTARLDKLESLISNYLITNDNKLTGHIPDNDNKVITDDNILDNDNKVITDDSIKLDNGVPRYQVINDDSHPANDSKVITGDNIPENNNVDVSNQKITDDNKLTGNISENDSKVITGDNIPENNNVDVSNKKITNDSKTNNADVSNQKITDDSNKKEKNIEEKPSENSPNFDEDEVLDTFPHEPTQTTIKGNISSTQTTHEKVAGGGKEGKTELDDLMNSVKPEHKEKAFALISAFKFAYTSSEGKDKIRGINPKIVTKLNKSGVTNKSDKNWTLNNVRDFFKTKQRKVTATDLVRILELDN